jgi:hypothetical protein
MVQTRSDEYLTARKLFHIPTRPLRLGDNEFRRVEIEMPVTASPRIIKAGVPDRQTDT